MGSEKSVCYIEVSTVKFPLNWGFLMRDSILFCKVVGYKEVPAMWDVRYRQFNPTVDNFEVIIISGRDFLFH